MSIHSLRREQFVNSERLLALASILALLVCWELLSTFAFARLSLIFPSTVEILTATYSLLADGSLTHHFVTTATAVGTAIILAIVLGVSLGAIIGHNRFVAEAVEPLLYYFSSVPKIVLYPLILMVFGLGIESKVTMGFLSAMFPIMVNSIVGTMNIDENHVQVGRSYNATRWQLFKEVYLPSTAIYHVNGVRLGMGVAIISVLLAELFASQAGLGNQISFYFNNLLIARMYGILLIVFAVSFSLNILLLRLEKQLNKRGYHRTDSGSTTGF